MALTNTEADPNAEMQLLQDILTQRMLGLYAPTQRWRTNTSHPARPYTTEEARAFKRVKNLSAQSEVDAESFLKATHPGRQVYQSIIVQLESRDKLSQILAYQNAHFEVSDTLRKACGDWAHAAVLSSTARSYRDVAGKISITASIMTVMRAQGIKELPPAKETGETLDACLLVNLKDSNQPNPTKC
ncbi:hypothetical protein B0H10DRAFT_1952175 [Mycena sp. CBHHK59/15]|nr:hypothetical protein B0H10DRAFT_1952175 [Mycena sp. CBHHK59/15]